MDFLLYIQKLQDNLTALNIPQEKIHAIINQESALAQTKTSAEHQIFFTQDRINLLLDQEKNNHAPLQTDETATIVPQGSSFYQPIRIIDEEKTILPTSSKATIQSLSDEATMVVISQNTLVTAEEQTIAPSTNLKKLLSENETVRISEKDTVFFNTLPPSTRVEIQEDTTIPGIPLTTKNISVLDTDITRPAFKANSPVYESVTEETRPIPTNIFHQALQPKDTQTKEIEKKEQAPTKKTPNQPNTPSAVRLSPEAIRNPHPILSFFWLTLLLVPSIFFLGVVISAFIITVDLLFLLSFTFVTLFYLSILLLPLFLAVYSVVFSILYWQSFRIADGFAEFGISLFLCGGLLIIGYFFYRHFINATEFIVEKCKSFNQKTFRLLRNLYRYSVKGAEKL